MWQKGCRDGAGWLGGLTGEGADGEEDGRKMGDSLLKWLGHDKPPSVRVSHKVWRKQLVDRTRQLKLGADRARQRSGMLMLDGTDILRVVEAKWRQYEQGTSQQEQILRLSQTLQHTCPSLIKMEKNLS